MEEEKVITQGGRYIIHNTNSEQRRTRLLLFLIVLQVVQFLLKRTPARPSFLSECIRVSEYPSIRVYQVSISDQPPLAGSYLASYYYHSYYPVTVETSFSFSISLSNLDINIMFYFSHCNILLYLALAKKIYVILT